MYPGQPAEGTFRGLSKFHPYYRSALIARNRGIAPSAEDTFKRNHHFFVMRRSCCYHVCNYVTCFTICVWFVRNVAEFPRLHSDVRCEYNEVPGTYVCKARITFSSLLKREKREKMKMTRKSSCVTARGMLPAAQPVQGNTPCNVLRESLSCPGQDLAQDCGVLSSGLGPGTRLGATPFSHSGLDQGLDLRLDQGIPLCEQTYRCENITSHRTTYAGGKY